MYEYYQEEGVDHPLFLFKTIHGLTYYVSFKKMGVYNYPFNNLYSLDFDEIDKTKSIPDTKISITISHIIYKFIKDSTETILFYVCDSSDSRHQCRSRLFSIWKSNITNPNYVKLDIDLNQTEINMSFIYDITSYDQAYIEENVVLYLDSLEREKQ